MDGNSTDNEGLLVHLTSILQLQSRAAFWPFQEFFSNFAEVNLKVTQDPGVIFIQTAEHQGDEQKNIWEAPSGVNAGKVRWCLGRGSCVLKLQPYPSKLLISHRIKLSGPVDTEPKTIRAKMDRMVSSGHLNSYYFGVSRVISFARGVCLLQNQPEWNDFRQTYKEMANWHCFLTLWIQVWLQGVSLEAKTAVSSLVTISLC